MQEFQLPTAKTHAMFRANLITCLELFMPPLCVSYELFWGRKMRVTVLNLTIYLLYLFLLTSCCTLIKLFRMTWFRGRVERTSGNEHSRHRSFSLSQPSPMRTTSTTSNAIPWPWWPSSPGYNTSCARQRAPTSPAAKSWSRASSSPEFPRRSWTRRTPNRAACAAAPCTSASKMNRNAGGCARSSAISRRPPLSSCFSRWNSPLGAHGTRSYRNLSSKYDSRAIATAVSVLQSRPQVAVKSCCCKCHFQFVCHHHHLGFPCTVKLLCLYTQIFFKAQLQMSVFQTQLQMFSNSDILNLSLHRTNSNSTNDNFQSFLHV